MPDSPLQESIGIEWRVNYANGLIKFGPYDSRSEAHVAAQKIVADEPDARVVVEAREVGEWVAL